MYKQTIDYVDFDGNKRSEDFYFNLTKAELVEMELGTDGGMSGILDRITRAKDTPSIIKEIKNIILKAYGIKSADGRKFLKNDQIRQEFECSEPFSEMFMSLATDDEKAAAFIIGIMPKDVAEAMPADFMEQAKNGTLPANITALPPQA